LGVEIRRLTVGLLRTNCYLVFENRCKKAILIDPGAEGQKIVDFAKKLEVEIESVVLTHGHFDHTGAAGFIQRRTKVPVYIGEKDVPLLENPGWMEEFIENPGEPKVEGYCTVKEGDKISAGKVTLTVIETPGHTPGSISLYMPGYLFSGDLIFRGSVGRTDLPGGNMDQMLSSIRKKILVLPDVTRIYPGHDEPTTLGEERLQNPFF